VGCVARTLNLLAETSNEAKASLHCILSPPQQRKRVVVEEEKEGGFFLWAQGGKKPTGEIRNEK